MIKKNSLLLILITIISSCGNKSFDTAEEISAFISDEDNELCYTKEINGVTYSLQYRPTDLLVKQELGDSVTEKKVKQLREKYNKYLYFNLSMSLNGQELLSNVVRDKQQFGQMVNDLAFSMDQKVHLYSPLQDTLNMTDFVYPRMYGMTDATTILIVYPRDKQFLHNDYLNFTIEDLGLNTGEVKFKVNTQPLKNEPQLNF